MNAARSKIKARKLNMKKTADIVIAIGIFIAVVGFAIFAASAIASWRVFLSIELVKENTYKWNIFLMMNTGISKVIIKI